MQWTTAIVTIVLSGLMFTASARAQQAPASQPAQLQRILERLKQLDLSAQQHAQVDVILQQARINANAAGTPQDKRQAMQNALGQITSSVLTPAQRKQFEQNRPNTRETGLLRELNLTPQQQNRVQAIHAQAQAAAENTQDPRSKRQINQEAQQKIRQTVLLPEQRQKLDELQAKQRNEPSQRRQGMDKPRPRPERGPGQHGPASRPA